MAWKVTTTALRRGTATLVDAAVLAAWAFRAWRMGAGAWDWLVFGIPLGMVLWFDVLPYRTAASAVRLMPLARWLLLFRFVALAFLLAFAGMLHPLVWAIAGVALLFAIGALLRTIEERNPLRIVTAAPGGGFLVRFPPDETMDSELARLPDGQRDGGHWKFPATKESADALLRFAREHGFEFKP